MTMASYEDLLNASAVITREYRIRLLTPMAIHGADQVPGAEFRLSSFRGVMRYLWRALQNESDFKQLLNKEELLFGGVGSEKSRGKSPLRFSGNFKHLQVQNHELLPHREHKVPSQKGHSKNAINAGQTVSIFSTVHQSNEDKLEYYHNLLELVFMLVSMGQRSRRGFGAIQWDQHHFSNVSDFFQQLSHLFLKLGIRTEINKSLNGLSLENEARLRPILKTVWVGEGKSSYAEVLREFGHASSERKDIPIVQTKSGTKLGARPLGSGTPRLASPLWGTVRHIGGQWHPVISELQTEPIAKAPDYIKARNCFLERMGVKL